MHAPRKHLRPTTALHVTACLIAAASLILTIVAVDISQYLNWSQPRFAHPMQSQPQSHTSQSTVTAQQWNGLGYTIIQYANTTDNYRAIAPLNQRNTICITQPEQVTATVHRALADNHSIAATGVLGSNDGFVGVWVMGCEAAGSGAVAYAVAIEQDTGESQGLHVDSCAIEQVTMATANDGSIYPQRLDDTAADRSLGRCESNGSSAGGIPWWTNYMWKTADDVVQNRTASAHK